MHRLLSMKNSTAALLVTAGLVTIPCASAFAQEDNSTTAPSPETTTEEIDDTTEPDETDESSTTGDETWPDFSTSSSGGYPEYVSCYADGSVGGVGAVPWPGSTFPGGTHGLPGWPGGPNFGILNVSCSVEGRFGMNMYRCSCGSRDSTAGELPPSWFQERPTWSEQLVGCRELIKTQCGNMRIAARASCESDYGQCRLHAIRRDDNLKRDELVHSCNCVDGDRWSSAEILRDVDVISPNASQLEERCASEVSHCGKGSFGQAGAGLLVSGQKGRLETTCSSSYGNCFLVRNEQGLGEVRCHCVDGSVTNLSGDLGWKEAGLSTLVQDCEQRVRACTPSQGAATTAGVFPDEGGGATGGAIAGGEDQSGDSVIRVDSGNGKSVSCSIGASRSFAAMSLFGLLGLLGLRRRR